MRLHQVRERQEVVKVRVIIIFAVKLINVAIAIKAQHIHNHFQCQTLLVCDDSHGKHAFILPSEMMSFIGRRAAVDTLNFCDLVVVCIPTGRASPPALHFSKQQQNEVLSVKALPDEHVKLLDCNLRAEVEIAYSQARHQAS